MKREFVNIRVVRVFAEPGDDLRFVHGGSAKQRKLKSVKGSHVEVFDHDGATLSVDPQEVFEIGDEQVQWLPLNKMWVSVYAI